MSYRPELFGVKTYVDEGSQKGIDTLNAGGASALPNGESPNHESYRSSPSSVRRREQALPITNEGHPEGRDRKSIPAPGVFLTPSDSSNNGDRPVHQRARIQPMEGEQYGHPYIDQGTHLHKRRTMTASEHDIILANIMARVASDLEAEDLEAADWKSPVKPTFNERQQPQAGPAKLYHQRYYRRHRNKKKRMAKVRHRRNKNKGVYKLDRKRRNEHPEWYTRRRAIGYRSNAERSRDDRQKKKASEEVVNRWLIKTADFLIERGPAHRRESLLDYDYQDSLPSGEHTDYGLPSQYAPVVKGTAPFNREEDVMPTQGFTQPTVRDNPGSAKVIPSGKGFVNKLASKKGSNLFLEYKKEFMKLQKGKQRYRSEAGNKVTWITAYNQKNPKAIEDFKRFAQDKAQRELKGIKGAATRLKTKAGRVASAIVSATKKVASVAKSEVMGMVKTPKVLFDMATGNYDFDDKKQLKEDSKMIWGSLVYYGGIALALSTGGLGSTAVALGKSVATHATLGAVSSDLDFFGFLSVEAAETVAGAVGKGSELQEALGGFVSTDLFDAVVSGVSTALSAVVASSGGSGKAKPESPDAVMQAVLTKYLERIADAASSLSKKDEIKVLKGAFNER